jgi:hypothetical protein
MSTENTPKPCPQCGRFVAANGICKPCQSGAQVDNFSGAVSFLFGGVTAAPTPVPRAKSLLEILRGE